MTRSPDATGESRVTHTPGPWKHDSDAVLPDEWYADELIMADGKVVAATVTCPENGYSRKQGLINAPLIAAAPELLEALVGLIWLAESHFSDKVQLEQLSFCRAVLKKARGE